MQIMESTSQNNSEDIQRGKGRNGSGWRKKVYLSAAFSKLHFVNEALLYTYGDNYSCQYMYIPQ